jgi:very-short-patch-repair endonuclease
VARGDDSGGDRRWADLAERQHGVVSRAQLRRAGLSDAVVDGLLADDAVRRVHAGVFVVHGAPSTYLSRLWQAVLATAGVIGFATAAHLWGAVEERPECIDVIIARSLHLTRIDGVRTHRIDLPPGSVAHYNGLPITTRRISLLDHLGRLRIGDAGRLADRALQQGWLAPGDFAARVRAEPGRTGNVVLRRLAVETGDGAAAKSERLLHSILREAGVRGWRPNVRVRHRGELIGEVDVAFKEAMVAIEVDGMAFHVDVDRFQRDRTKQNRLVALGWTVLRFTWADLTQRPDYVAATVRSALDRG